MHTSFADLVRSRRSIRNFSTKEIDAAVYEKCIEAARRAPSACNSQAWKFVVINDTSVRKTIAENIFNEKYTMNAFASNAAGYIAIISEKLKFPAWLGGMIRNTNFTRIDLGLACSHIILQAQYLGIGSCILGWFNEKKLKKILSVPGNKRIELLIALGYPENNTVPEKKMKNINEVCNYNKY